MSTMDLAKDMCAAIKAHSPDRDVRFLTLQWTTHALVTSMWETMIDEADEIMEKLIPYHVHNPFWYNDHDCKAFRVPIRAGRSQIIDGFAHRDQNRLVLILLETTDHGKQIKAYDCGNLKGLWAIVKKINQGEAYFDCRDNGFLGGSPDPFYKLLKRDAPPVDFYTGNVKLAQLAMFDIESLHYELAD